jgi:hypothetical protein
VIGIANTIPHESFPPHLIVPKHLHGQAYSFTAQCLNPAAISVQSQGAVWVVSLRSTSRNVNIQITNGGGGVTNELVSSINLYFSSQAQAQAAAQSFTQLAGH